MILSRWRLYPCGLLLSLAGCASVAPREGFPAVEQSVKDRIGQRIVWNSGLEADRAVEAQIDELLKGELSPDQAVQIALLNNRNLQAVYESLGVAQADLVAAGLMRNPIFSGDLKFSARGGGTKADLGLSANILDLIFIPLRKRQAAAQYESAKWTVTVAVLDLSAQVRTQMLELIAARQLAELRETVAASFVAGHELAKRLHQAGNLSDLELARAQAAADEAQIESSAARAQSDLLQQSLNALMGLRTEQGGWKTLSRLPDAPAEPVTVSEIEQRAVAASLDLASTATQVEIAKQELASARPLGVLSDLELGATAEREGDGEWHIGPSVAAPVPIFSQGQPALAASQARLWAAMQTHRAREVEVRATARSAAAQLVAARARMEKYRDVLVPLRHKITQETQKHYNAMQIGAFELLSVKREEVEAAKASIEALKDYWLAQARLDLLLAGRMPGKN